MQQPDLLQDSFEHGWLNAQHIVFQLLRSNVAKQVARFVCTSYRSFSLIGMFKTADVLFIF